MKRIIIVLAVFSIFIGSLYAQEPRFIFDSDSINRVVNNDRPAVNQGTPETGSVQDSAYMDSLHHLLPEIPAWRIDPRFGTRYAVEMDTLFNGYHQESLVDGQGVAVAYLGNWGSPAQSKIFFERDEVSQFGFLDAFNYYNKSPGKHTFLDMKEPYSNFKYHSGGGRQSKEEMFEGVMSLSFNKRFTLGFDIDYVYSRGFYTSLSSKQINYSVFSSYITDKYKMHAIFIQNNYTNVENGGLVLGSSVKDGYLNSENARDLPVNISDTRNRMRGRQLYMNHKYSIGFNEKDTEKFVPVASVIWASYYADQKRSFTTDQLAALDTLYHYKEPESVWGKPIITEGSSDNTASTSSLNDRMSYYSFKNTLSIALNEGFRDWVKFGLTGFIEYDTRKYTLPNPDYPSLLLDEYSQNSTVVGGLLSKQKGEHLRYNLYADFGILGYNLGEARLKADVSTQFKLGGRDIYVKANAYIKNLKPTFFETNFVSRYYNWTENSEVAEKYSQFTQLNFGDIKRTFIGGEISIPHTKTRLSGGLENIKNYIYYDRANDNSNVEIKQAKENIQILTLRLDQNLSLGVLHFDNQIVYQKNLNKDVGENVIPLPELSLYSNLYLQFKVAKVLDVQFGVDAHIHTDYYAPGYDPALLQFYNQHERKIGGFPISTVYADFHLKRTRFFVMMYNIGSKITNKNYFVADGYAIDPMIFKFGLTWNFMN